MLVLCFCSASLLCWPNYGMWYLRPNRFTMMLVCGKSNLKKVLEFNSTLLTACELSWSYTWLKSSLPFWWSLKIANRWRWLIVKAMVNFTGHRCFMISKLWNQVPFLNHLVIQNSGDLLCWKYDVSNFIQVSCALIDITLLSSSN